MLAQEKINPDSQEKSQLMSLEEFFDWYPNGFGRFELHKGVVIEMQPTGTHEQVAGFLASKLSVYIERLNLPFFIPRQGLIKALNSNQSAYIPDVMVLDYNALNDEPLWKKRSTITRGKTVTLAMEVVSSNWQDDYLIKLGEYEKLGIREYWIVDYLGLGGRRYIGNPKQPTISVYHLVDDEYTVNLFTGQDVVISPSFPEFTLTAEQIFQSGQ